MTSLMNNIEPKVFRKTADHEGWREFFSPATKDMQYLSYARLLLTTNVTKHSMNTGEREWAFFCIKPKCKVKADGKEFELGKYDMLYVPRDCSVEIIGEPGCDIAAGGSPAHIKTEPQLVRYNDIKDDSKFFFDVGTTESSTKRRIHNMIGHNVKASRLLAGFTIGQPTAWTSWPPHEHSTSKEEFYLFFDMPKEAFSVQFVYSSPDNMEFKEPVRSDDCVTVPGGFHPTCAAPGYQSVFLWVMAAFDPEKDRDFKHGITIQSDYKDIKFV